MGLDGLARAYDDRASGDDAVLGEVFGTWQLEAVIRVEKAPGPCSMLTFVSAL